MIHGNGATVFATTPGDRVRGNFLVKDSTGIVFTDLIVKGANPHAGMWDDAYVASKEAQHGFNFLGVYDSASSM